MDVAVNESREYHGVAAIEDDGGAPFVGALRWTYSDNVAALNCDESRPTYFAAIGHRDDESIGKLKITRFWRG
jgi:hypothetical protein